MRNVFINLASTFLAQSTHNPNLNVSLFLQLAVTATGLFTLLAVLIIGVIICRRSSTTAGMRAVHFMLPYKPCVVALS